MFNFLVKHQVLRFFDNFSEKRKTYLFLILKPRADSVGSGIFFNIFNNYPNFRSRTEDEKTFSILLLNKFFNMIYKFIEVIKIFFYNRKQFFSFHCPIQMNQPVSISRHSFYPPGKFFRNNTLI